MYPELSLSIALKILNVYFLSNLTPKNSHKYYNSSKVKLPELFLSNVVNKALVPSSNVTLGDVLSCKLFFNLAKQIFTELISTVDNCSLSSMQNEPSINAMN